MTKSNEVALTDRNAAPVVPSPPVPRAPRFVPAFSELSATVLLYSAGTENIAVAMMRLNDGGKLEVVAALAVFTIAVILVVSLALNWFTGRSQSRLDTSRQKS